MVGELVGVPVGVWVGVRVGEKVDVWVGLTVSFDADGLGLPLSGIELLPVCAHAKGATKKNKKEKVRIGFKV